VGITWTKEWQASDDGTIISGLDLKNIQDDITSGSTGDATSLWSIDIDEPTAGDDGSVMYYDHGLSAYGWLNVDTIIPTGVILLWSGAISAIPSGWTLCDGTAGAPDLTDRFVIHADSDGGGTNDVGDTGGVSSHTLTGAESGEKGHGHILRWSILGAGTAYLGSEDGPQNAYNTEASGAVVAVGASSASSAHTNRDKYYALAYIMKT